MTNDHGTAPPAGGEPDSHELASRIVGERRRAQEAELQATLRRIDWPHYRNLGIVAVWRAVLLSLGFDPDRFTFDPRTGFMPRPGFPEQPRADLVVWVRRMEVAATAAASGRLPSSEPSQAPASLWPVELGLFACWARSLPEPWTMPAELNAIGEQHEQAAPENAIRTAWGYPMAAPDSRAFDPSPWLALVEWTVAEAACLLCAERPRDLADAELRDVSRSAVALMYRNLKDAVGRGALPHRPGPAAGAPGLDRVVPGEAVAWAIARGVDVPEALRELTVSREVTHAAPASTRRWPWGEHETALLRHLAAAAREWWSTYDPEQPGTAPTAPQVTDWLVARGVSRSTAGAMATILRADKLPTGRRPRADP